MPSENNINNFELISFQRSSITRNGITKSTPLILNGDMAKRSKKNPVNEIVYRIFFVAPRVGLEPTTARLTAACSTDWAIEDYNKNTVLSLDYVSGTFFSTFKTAYSIFHPQSWTCSWYSGIIIAFVPFWSSPRPISDSQLHVLPHFHLCPIYLVVFKGSYWINSRDILS